MYTKLSSIVLSLKMKFARINYAGQQNRCVHIPYGILLSQTPIFIVTGEILREKGVGLIYTRFVYKKITTVKHTLSAP